MKITVFIKFSYVSGLKPSVFCKYFRCPLRVITIPFHNNVTFYLNLSVLNSYLRSRIYFSDRVRNRIRVNVTADNIGGLGKTISYEKVDSVIFCLLYKLWLAVCTAAYYSLNSFKKFLTLNSCHGKYHLRKPRYKGKNCRFHLRYIKNNVAHVFTGIHKCSCINTCKKPSYRPKYMGQRKDCYCPLIVSVSRYKQTIVCGSHYRSV